MYWPGTGSLACSTRPRPTPGFAPREFATAGATPSATKQATMAVLTHATLRMRACWEKFSDAMLPCPGSGRRDGENGTQSTPSGQAPRAVALVTPRRRGGRDEWRRVETER